MRFIREAEAFNSFAQVTRVKRFSSLNLGEVEEQTTYLNDLPHWVLPLEVKNLGGAYQPWLPHGVTTIHVWPTLQRVSF
jgi:hypothetical protein